MESGNWRVILSHVEGCARGLLGREVTLNYTATVQNGCPSERSRRIFWHRCDELELAG